MRALARWRSLPRSGLAPIALALLDLEGAVARWRGAECSHPDQCAGENHVEDCAVELARQDILASHNAVEAVP
jgi:hypothetical protein